MKLVLALAAVCGAFILSANASAARWPIYFPAVTELASSIAGRPVDIYCESPGEWALDGAQLCRAVPLFPSIRRLLLERKARLQFSRDEDFVFGSAIGTPMDPGNFARREWRPALRRAGLPHWRFHDLRHFAVSQLIAEGADILLLARIAGHKDPAVTLRVYSHLMVEQTSAAAEKFDPLPYASAPGW